MIIDHTPHISAIIEFIKGGASVSVSARSAPSISVSRPSVYVAPKASYSQTITPKTLTVPVITRAPVVNPFTNKPASVTPIIMPREFRYPSVTRSVPYVRNPSTAFHPIFFMPRSYHQVSSVDYNQNTTQADDQDSEDIWTFLAVLAFGVMVIVILCIFVSEF